MVIQPKVRGFICTTAHPAGCRQNVKEQIDYVKGKPSFTTGQKVLVIGCSTGYGLATRIAAAFGGHADTIGVMYEKAASGKRTATPGYYNTAAFEEYANAEGLYAETINGDAFSKEIKEKTIQTIRRDLGSVDLIIYSVAAPRRTTTDGITYSSVLKTIDKPFTNKNLNLRNNTIDTATIEPATEDEVTATIKVMGGEDWMEWIRALSDAGVLSDNALTLAYSYTGPELTYPVYKNGTIGMAKEHLFQTSLAINREFAKNGIHAYISVNKALVTQSSCAIPIVPLYITLMYKVMKEHNVHEGCVEQMFRLFSQKIQPGQVETDDNGCIRLDDWELRPDIQQEIIQLWSKASTDNIHQISDIDGYWKDFYRLFGFGLKQVDYEADIPL